MPRTDSVKHTIRKYVPALCTHRPSLLPIVCVVSISDRSYLNLLRTMWLRGKRSRNKASVGEPADGSLRCCCSGNYRFYLVSWNVLSRNLVFWYCPQWMCYFVYYPMHLELVCPKDTEWRDIVAYLWNTALPFSHNTHDTQMAIWRPDSVIFNASNSHSSHA